MHNLKKSLFPLAQRCACVMHFCKCFSIVC